MTNLIADPERWANEGTGALSLRLARSKAQIDQLGSSEQNLVASFHAQFIHPLFGQEETIYGYEDLEINLAFNSSTLKNHLAINYKAKLPESSPVKPDPIEETFYKFIPPDYTKSEAVFNAELESEATASFVPPGQKISSYRPLACSKGKTKSEHFLTARRWERCENEEDEAEEDVVYELWAANWKTPGFRDYYRRMKVLVLLYIDGASYLEEDDDRWEFVVLFEKRKNKPNTGSQQHSYHFIGYVTLYSFYHYPSSIRLRLSQFIILPPYQSAGHGSMLYSQIFQYLLKRPEVAELTLEDPSESFEDLRDKEDLKLLFANGVFDERELSQLVPVDREWYRNTKTKWKLADRQFARLLEIALRWRFATLKEPMPKLERAYRIAVKERLYRFNYDSLVDVPKEERIERLKATFEGLMDDYDRLLRGERREINYH